jgi:hypothetical protein
MEKFLERQYQAMCNREEQKLMEHNLGKIHSHQKTINEVINLSFAYQDIAPSGEIARISKLNPMLDGSNARKQAVK